MFTLPYVFKQYWLQLQVPVGPGFSTAQHGHRRRQESAERRCTERRTEPNAPFPNHRPLNPYTTVPVVISN